MGAAGIERSKLRAITGCEQSFLRRVVALGSASVPRKPVAGYLFFFHADSTLLPGALDRINEVLMADAKVIGGNFRLVFGGDTSFSLWLTGFYAWIRSIGLYYGDSGIFVRRSVYEPLGGFRPIPLMPSISPSEWLAV